MLTVQKLKRDGIDLSNGPYPVDPGLLASLRRRPEAVRQVLTTNHLTTPDIDLDLD